MFTAAASSSAGMWRAAFLSLRDEISTTPPPPVPLLLEDLLFSHSSSILFAVSLLPPHELTSDCLFLLDLVSKADGLHWIPVSRLTCQLIHDVCARVLLQHSSSSWPLLLHSFASVLEFLLRQPMPSLYSPAYFSRIEPVIQYFETLRRLAALYYINSSHPDNIHLVKFLLRIIPLLHHDLLSSYGFSNQDTTLDLEKKLPSLWDAMALAFGMLGGAFSVSESLFPSDVCQSMLEVLFMPSRLMHTRKNTTCFKKSNGRPDIGFKKSNGRLSIQGPACRRPNYVEVRLKGLINMPLVLWRIQLTLLPGMHKSRRHE